MKIENKEVSIKIGNKVKTFKNLILNSYLDLFADSFINFKDKDLPYCLVNLSKENTITEKSTSMEYDTILEADFSNNIEILTENTVTNKYYYMNPANMERPLSDFEGQTIKGLGFANYDYENDCYKLYAFLDVSKYNVRIQPNQPVIISRIDKIESDMKLYSSTNKIKGPIHLTKRGMTEMNAMEYDKIVPKLYSVGFGILPQKINEEYLAKDLQIKRNSVGQVDIISNFKNHKENGLFPSNDLYPSHNLYPQKATYNLLMYKFKLYKEVWDDTEMTYEDTGYWYIQYAKISKYGQFDKLKIKYEGG